MLGCIQQPFQLTIVVERHVRHIDLLGYRSAPEYSPPGVRERGRAHCAAQTSMAVLLSQLVRVGPILQSCKVT